MTKYGKTMDSLLSNLNNFKCLKDRPYIILCNYGDDSIALLQWMYEQYMMFETEILPKLIHNIRVVSIETGFASSSAPWIQRCAEGKQFAEQCGFKTVQLTSKISFEEAVMGRTAFPSPKFQWCATLLKGLPLLDWLDEIDPSCRAVILIAKRRSTLTLPESYNISNDNLLENTLSTNSTFSEWIDKAEHFNDRSVWHPIIEMGDEEKDALLHRAGFSPLGHRSLECDPCVNSGCRTLCKLSEKDIQKVKNLEESLESPMFSPQEWEGASNIEAVVKRAKEKLQHPQLQTSESNEVAAEPSNNTSNNSNDLILFYRGCGNPFGCGL